MYNNYVNYKYVTAEFDDYSSFIAKIEYKPNLKSVDHQK